MQFNVAQLLKEATGGTRKYELNESIDDFDPELVIQAPIAGKVKFTKIPQGVLVIGQLKTVLELNCNRCLEVFELPAVIQLEEEFRSLVDLQTGAHLPQSDEEDEAILINDKNLLDLYEVIRQALLLALPSQRLCQEDCQGLCMSCGKNLNEDDCGCPTESYDPRWDALKTLMTNKE
jgi:uncharacterized protein